MTRFWNSLFHVCSIRLHAHFVSSFACPIQYMIWNVHVSLGLCENILQWNVILRDIPHYPNSTNIPGNLVYIVHVCIKSSIKVLKHNWKLLLKNVLTLLTFTFFFICANPYHFSFQKHKKRIALFCSRMIDVTLLYHVLIKT